MDTNTQSGNGLQQQQHARDSAVIPRILPTYLQQHSGTHVVSPRDFTPRQHDVLKLLCEGLPNKVISSRLGISPGTVKIHMSHILRKLGVTSRLQAAIAARRDGLIG